MCDEGRFGWKYVHSENRLTAPRIGSVSQNVVAETAKPLPSANDAPDSQLNFRDPWPTVIKATRDALNAAISQNPGSFLFLLSPMMTCEEAYLLAKYAKSLHKRVTLGLGPRANGGEDDRYPKDSYGNPPAPKPPSLPFVQRSAQPSRG